MAFFAYFIGSAKISYESAVEWAYEQFNNERTPEWIEKISIEADSHGILEILTSEFERGALKRVPLFSLVPSLNFLLRMFWVGILVF